MGFVNKLGRILGVFSAVFIIPAVFLSYVSLDVLSISIFSMSLFEYNKLGAIVIIALAVLAFLCAYFNRGFLTSLFGIVIFVLNIFFANNLSTGISELDTAIKQVSSLFGDLFTPGIGFIFVAAGSFILFVSGLMINKAKSEEKEPVSKKTKIIITTSIVTVLAVCGGIICFIYPGYFKKTKYVIDERTEKKFDVVDGKVQVYLPVSVVCDAKNDGRSYSITAKYDDKARLIEKDYQSNDSSNDTFKKSTIFNYNIDGELSHITEKVGEDEFILDWLIDYSPENRITSIVREEKKEVIDSNVVSSVQLNYGYNNSGLITNCGPQSGSFDATGQNMYSYTFNEDGLIDKTSVVGNLKSFNISYRYNGDLLEESILEGEDSSNYQYVKQVINRDESRIAGVDLYKNNNANGTNIENNYKYEYEGNKLISILCDESFDSNKNTSKTQTTYTINYVDDKINDISRSSNDDFGNLDCSYEYENGEIVGITRNADVGNYSDSIQIDYELFEIDLNDWDGYVNKYYTYRYEMLHDSFCLYELDYTGLLELKDGYFNQILEYNTFKSDYYIDDEPWFCWVTLPRVLERDYYKKEK